MQGYNFEGFKYIYAVVYSGFVEMIESQCELNYFMVIL